MHLPTFTLFWFVGTLAIVISILLKVIGYPDQILKNYRRKSTEGISNLYFILAFLSYFFIAWHGAMQNDWVVIITQGTGVITTGVVLWQIAVYSKNKKSS